MNWKKKTALIERLPCFEEKNSGLVTRENPILPLWILGISLVQQAQVKT